MCWMGSMSATEICLNMSLPDVISTYQESRMKSLVFPRPYT